MKMSSDTYDKLTWLSNLIPLIVAFVGTVLAAVGIGEATINTVLIIIGAVGTLLNGILQISSKNYYKNQNVATIDIFKESGE